MTLNTGGSGSSGGGGGIAWDSMIKQYTAQSNQVSSMTSGIGNTSVSKGVSMQSLFQLQLAMNNLSMFGTTLTNVMQGVQDIAMGIARNAKGS